MLIIDAQWERLGAGSPEERACFCALGIHVESADKKVIWLTEAVDSFVQRTRERVHVSGYRLAEWLAWNWWRLRWEPRRDGAAWALAHHLGAVGGGYVWPNISVLSDGESVTFEAKPTQPQPQEPLRYIASSRITVVAQEYEHAVQRFIEQVRGQLRAEGVASTNLDHIWENVQADRVDKDRWQRCKFEALLGLDPDEGEAHEAMLARLLADADDLGLQPMNEVAAGWTKCGAVWTAETLRDVARTHGFEARPVDAAQLAGGTEGLLAQCTTPWKKGAAAAQLLRTEQKLGTAPLSDEKLAGLAGVSPTILSRSPGTTEFSFALDQGNGAGRVVLRRKWQTGRRFELARQLGDRLIGGSQQVFLFPVTDSNTYQQKLQRAFAAELLCPFATLKDRLQGDYRESSIEDVAEEYEVSRKVVWSQLVNHGEVDRERLDVDMDVAA